MVFKLGADPECFLRKVGNNHLVSAHDIVPGTKLEPYKLPNGGACQADGTALEVNIPPSESGEEFADNIVSVYTDVLKLLPKGLRLSFDPTVIYSEKYWNTIPDEAKRLGCSPDYDGMNEGKELPPPPENKVPPRMRTAGGHLHLGWCDELKEDPFEKDHFQDCVFMAKMFSEWADPVYSLDITYHFKEFKRILPLDRKRLKLYGDIGSFRPKPYGVELRSPSCSWLLGDEDSWKGMFNSIKKYFEEYQEGLRFNKAPPLSYIRNRPREKFDWRT